MHMEIQRRQMWEYRASDAGAGAVRYKLLLLPPLCLLSLLDRFLPPCTLFPPLLRLLRLSRITPDNRAQLIRLRSLILIPPPALTVLSAVRIH